MAKVISENYLERLEGSTEIDILSAGTGAVADEPPTPEARKVMSELGMDIDEHRSQSLTPDLIKKADLILVMTQRHKNHVIQLVPDAKDKVHLLKEYGSDAAKWESFKLEAQELYEDIEEQKRDFFSNHRSVIDGLEKRKQELKLEIEQIDKELAIWEDKLVQVAAKEEALLAQMEKRLRESDIIDPFGQPLEYYRACATQLREHVSKALERFLIQDDK
jgi:protein-tyrosine phosphatase